MKKLPVDNLPYLRSNKRAEVDWDENGLPFNAALKMRNRQMQVVIPTHQRPDRQITFKGFPEFLRDMTILLTSTEADAEAIRKNHEDLLVDPVGQVISIESVYKSKLAVDSIAKKRQWIIENFGSESIFQLDDDMYRFARVPEKFRVYTSSEGHPVNTNGSWRLTPKAKSEGMKLIAKEHLTDEFYVKALASLMRLMTGPDPKYAHVGLSSRMGNPFQKSSWRSNYRMMHSLGHNRGILLRNNIRFDAVALREDFYVTVKLLSLGLPNRVYFDVCVSPADYGAAGGVAQERTVERSNEEAIKLAAMFPEYIKVVDREYTDSIPRKEVVIAWAKICEHAVASKDIKAKRSLFG